MQARPRLAFLVLLILIVPLRWALAQQENRVALVIGEGRYQNVAGLPNTARDAQLVGRTLQGLGFKLVGGKPLIDLDKQALERALRSFRDQLSPLTVGLFYYAGHGIQLGGENYLVPIDARLSQAADADFELVNADLVLKQMNAGGSRLNIILLDACRNNPFSSGGFRSAGGGLAQMQAPKGTLISYATEPGKVAQDGPPGDDGPYARGIADAIVKPAHDVFQVFNDVGIIVDRLTNGTQRPWVTSSPIEGEFYFTALPAPAPTADDPNAIAVEIEFWDSVRLSSDADLLSSYLVRYPAGAFAALARTRIARLTPELEATARPPRPQPRSYDGTWRGIVACGISSGGGAAHGNAFTSQDIAFTVKNGKISGHHTGTGEITGHYGGTYYKNPYEEDYEGQIGSDGMVVVTGDGKSSMTGHYDIRLEGRIRDDGDLEAEGTIGARKCTLDYQRADGTNP